MRRIDLTFPARDESLSALVGRLSEPGTARHADNFVSNEDSYPRVVGQLEQAVGQGGVYLGVGPEQNFTYIARQRPSLAFILDDRRRNLLVQMLHRALFCLSSTRFEYLRRLTARNPPGLGETAEASRLVEAFREQPLDREFLGTMQEEVAAYLRAFGVLEEPEWLELARIQSRIAGPGVDARFLALPMYPTFGQLVETTTSLGHPAHYLASESHYQAVRERQLEDRVIPIVGDFSGAKALATLARWLRKRNLEVKVCYVSDVEFFLLRGGKFLAYVANLCELPWSDPAVLIRTSTREIVHPSRRRGDSGTTILADVRRFLRDAKQGRVTSPDDLFASP